MLAITNTQPTVATQVTCYRLEAALLAQIESGFRISPFMEAPALFVGHRALVLDKYRTPTQVGGLVFQASVKWVGNTYLTAESLNDDVLLHVDLRKPAGVSPKVRFFTGIQPEESILMDYDGQALVAFPHLGSAVTIFRCDGSVRVIERQGYNLVEKSLSVDKQAELRIERAKAALLDSEKLTKSFDNRVRLRDGALHQLLNIIEFSRSSGIHDRCLALIRQYRQAGYAGSIESRLQLLAPEELSSRGGSSYMLFAGDSPNKKGPPAERRAALAARAEAQRNMLREHFGKEPKANGKDKKKK